MALFYCRYIFLEYMSPTHALDAIKNADGYKLDKQHTFRVNLFTDFDKWVMFVDVSFLKSRCWSVCECALYSVALSDTWWSVMSGKFQKSSLLKTWWVFESLSGLPPFKLEKKSPTSSLSFLLLPWWVLRSSGFNFAKNLYTPDWKCFSPLQPRLGN